MDPLHVAVGLAVLLGAALQSATGFGFSLVVAPLLFAAVEPEQAVGLLLALGVIVNLMTLAGERRRPEPLRADVLAILGWALPGLVLGLLVLRSVDGRALQILVTVAVFASLAVQHAATRRSPEIRTRAWWAAPAAGLAAGALTTSTTTAGPPIVLHLRGRGSEPLRIRDTLTACFLGLSLLGALALALAGEGGAVPQPAWIAALAPLTVAGHLGGRRVFARLERGSYEVVLTGVLIVSATVGLVTALA